MANTSKNQGRARKRPLHPPQTQRRQPGLETKMRPRPVPITSDHHGSGKLHDRVALITGGDSGIGRAVAAAFAREGADICIVYLDEHDDADETRELVEREGRRAHVIAADIRSARACRQSVRDCVQALGGLDILVNNAAIQFERESVADIDPDDLQNTFATNVFAAFYLTAAALPHLRRAPGIIINTTSVTAYRGSPSLVDYSATKGALVAFTRSLSQQLVKDGIRVNAVAPGPIWTPLIPASFDKKKVASFGSDVPMGRAGEPAECAGAFVYLASADSSYVTGQVLHVNGGEIING